MKKPLFLCLTIILASLSTTGYADDLTKTLACDTCNTYIAAKDLAEDNHEIPICTASNSEVQLGTTTYSCVSTHKEIIVANPVTQTSYKFDVTTRQKFDWAPAYDIIVSDASLKLEEEIALDIFFDMDSDFRQTMTEASSIPFTLSSVVPYTREGFEYISLSNTGPSSTVDCSNHASNVLSGNVAFGNEIRRGFTNRITSQMRNQSWKDFTSSVQATGGSLDIGLSAGISVDFTHSQQDYFVTQTWDNGDKLVYQVTYNGEYERNITPATRNRARTERFLNLSFNFKPDSSRIDGTPVTALTRGGRTDLSGIPISVCLSEKLDELLDEKEIVVDGEAGGGSLVDVAGNDPTNGGSLIPPAGIWINLASCKIVEKTGTICESDTGNCYVRSIRFIDC